LTRKQNRKKALKELEELLNQVEHYVDVILVEGIRDIESLKNLGYEGQIIPTSQRGISDFDLIDKISQKYKNVLILTDFDKKGIELEKHFQKLLEQKNIKVEKNIRRNIGRLTSKIGVYIIESLDNIQQKVKNN
jgi:5S rRNA maturation endonuclease (ribonuclease M5)